MYILGINSYHGDSSACLLKDGLLLFAAEEERFNRIKHWAGFPVRSINFCLESAGISIADIDHIAINQDPYANLFRKFFYTLKTKPSLNLLSKSLSVKIKRMNISDDISSHFGSKFVGKLHQVEHHRAHLSSGFHVSPYKDSSVVSVDGFGDFCSTAWGRGSNNKIYIEGKVLFPHSLGIFYQAITQWLGFPNYGDEYKVMGLAPYGKPNYLKELRTLIIPKDNGSFELNLLYFLHHKKAISTIDRNGVPHFDRLFSDELTELLGTPRMPSHELTQRHMDIAHSAQAIYEETFFNLLNSIHQKHGLDSLCLAGGCAMNSVANGKVTLRTPYKNIYIQSAAGDAGGAIGAAFTVWHNQGGSRKFVMNHSYWGPSFSNEQISHTLNSHSKSIIEADCEIINFEEDEDGLCSYVADAIAGGSVVGWFQGPMEWGPRALGNRSILGDPRRSDMKDILNIKIKRRESFRPFAPSVLRDDVTDWFEQDGEVPFMMQVYSVRSNKRGIIPAVTHVDGSGRLQTVRKEQNLRYYKLIKAFDDKTGIPILLNTSFNENEPVVCNPDEALACFLRTKMDLLVLGDIIIRRRFHVV